MTTGKDEAQGEDIASGTDDDAPTTPTVELPPIDGDSPPMIHAQERALMEALLDEASEGWVETFGTRFGFPNASQDADDPSSAP